MGTVVKIYDHNIGKGTEFRRELRLASERITAGELIRRRVEAEIDELTAAEHGTSQAVSARVATWLVVPSLRERALNGDRGNYGPGTRGFVEADKVDREAMVACALDGFARNRFVMFFDGQQVTDLEALLAVTPESQVRFLKLVPLVGG